MPLAPRRHQVLPFGRPGFVENAILNPFELLQQTCCHGLQFFDLLEDKRGRQFTRTGDHHAARRFTSQRIWFVQRAAATGEDESMAESEVHLRLLGKVLVAVAPQGGQAPA